MWAHTNNPNHLILFSITWWWQRTLDERFLHFWILKCLCKHDFFPGLSAILNACVGDYLIAYIMRAGGWQLSTFSSMLTSHLQSDRESELRHCWLTVVHVSENIYTSWLIMEKDGNLLMTSWRVRCEEKKSWVKLAIECNDSTLFSSCTVNTKPFFLSTRHRHHHIEVTGVFFRSPSLSPLCNQHEVILEYYTS